MPLYPDHLMSQGSGHLDEQIPLICVSHTYIYKNVLKSSADST